MAATTVFAVAAFVGDGSPSNPRRPTMWGRLDSVLEVIATNNVCMKPDGTVDKALISQINVAFPVVEDLGPCGIVQQSMHAQTWEMIESHLLATNGYVVYGHDLASLKVSAQAAIDYIQPRLVAAGLKLSGTGTLYDQIVAWLAPARTTVFNTVALRALRNYYRNRLNAQILVELPSDLYAGNALDGVKFSTIRNAWQKSQQTDVGRMIHELYDLACFDIVVRSIP